jgi:hypothetical protein
MIMMMRVHHISIINYICIIIVNTFGLFKQYCEI